MTATDNRNCMLSIVSSCHYSHSQNQGSTFLRWNDFFPYFAQLLLSLTGVANGLKGVHQECTFCSSIIIESVLLSNSQQVLTYISSIR